MREKDEKESGDSSDESMEENRFPVVALGASAGGLEALEGFFGAVPEDSGMAFVVISHTNPDHVSMLPDLIRRKSRIKVATIENGMPLVPDTIFLPPSTSDPVLENGVFYLKDRPDKSSLHMPVDLFFKHMAQDIGDMSVGIILSGTGTDGTQGIRLIKEKAGLTIAQDPETAKHTGMPQSAIETGLIDFVLHAPEMPERLIQFFKYPNAFLRKSGAKKQPNHLNRILAFLASKTRNDFTLYKENTLTRRIERRLAITHSQNAMDYLQTLHREPKEVQDLLQDLLIGVTSFFRDPDAFAFLKKEVLPDMVSMKGSNPLRVWVPGCATGEEAYSMAITLKEALDEKDILREVQVFGTDIDTLAIEKARRGIYLQNIVSDVSPERIEHFFVREDSRYRVKSDIREHVVFAEQNVLADPPFSNLDLLVCRNLLIYLKPEAQNKLIPLFHYSLREGGILFLGSSEGVGRFQELFEPVSRDYNIYRKKNYTLGTQVQFPTTRRLERSDGDLAPVKEEFNHPQTIEKLVEQALIKDYAPACLVVNQQGEILHFHGRTGKYLEPVSGHASFQVEDMAREGLLFPLLSLLRRVNKENREIREKGVRVRTNHHYQRIDLVVKPLSDPPLKDCRLVIFEEVPETADDETVSEGRMDGEEAGRREAELERELMRLRQDYSSAMEELQSSNEELRSSNEEIHSSNEELQSTNEELESSREELQSLNEELNTVNSELNSKIEGLNEAYNAINAVLNSTRIAIVFLDNELRLKRFTPEATHLLNLIDSDIGRPLGHINHNLEYEELAEKTRMVLKNLSSLDDEVRTRDGHWYHMSIMVYRPQKGVIEGLVLTFINIDIQKKAQKDLGEMSVKDLSSARRFAENIVNTIRESLLVLDSKMRVVTANRSFLDTFRSVPEETEGKILFELGNGQWDIPELRELLREIIDRKKTFKDYLVEHRFPEIGFKRMLLNARMLLDEENQEDRLLLAIEDITDTNRPAGKGK